MKGAFIKFVPNLLSLLNAAFGVLAIYLISQGIDHLPLAITVLLFGSIPCDMLDGFAARKLDAKSEIGVDLDSLSDVISFAVAPAMILAHALSAAGSALPVLALLVVPFSVYRLAKFNHDTRQTESFLGLPTPANALFLCGFATAIAEADTVVVPDWFTAFLILWLCYLLVSERPMFGVKTFGRWKPVLKGLLVVCVVLSITALFLWGYKVLALIVLAYIVINWGYESYVKEVSKDAIKVREGGHA